MNVENIQIKYTDKIIIDNLSFSLEEGEIVGILGKNGSGKTTLLNAIVGLKEYSSGNISFSEQEISIGFFPESADSYDYLNGIEFLEVLSDLKGFSKNKLEELILWISSFINMPDLEIPLSILSKGNLEKVMFIQSLINYPKILALDEPFSGFDTKSIVGAKKILAEYSRRGNSIILSTHIIEMCSQICTKIIILNADKDNEIVTLDRKETLENNIKLLENKIL